MWNRYVSNQCWGMLLGKKSSVHNCAYSQQKPNINCSAYPVPRAGLQFKRPRLGPCLCQAPCLLLGNWSNPCSSLSGWAGTATHESSGRAAQPKPNPAMETVQSCFPEPARTWVRLPSTGQGYKYVLLIGAGQFRLK